MSDEMTWDDFIQEAIEYNRKRFPRDFTEGVIGSGEWYLFAEFGGQGVATTEEQLVHDIRAFQQYQSITADGKCGPETYRRIMSWWMSAEEPEQDAKEPEGYLLYGGKLLPVPFPCVPPTDSKGLNLIPHKDYNARRKDPTQVIWHWDVCFNARTCHRVLAGRDVSSHGCIDNDGTFYQFLDFRNHSAWHAGNSRVNRASIGIDVTNVVTNTKSNREWYAKRFGERPVIEASVHGREKELIGYYPAQIKTARELARWLNGYVGIPLDSPDTDTVINKPHLYKGHLAHYHVKTSKWDVCGFPFHEFKKERGEV